MTDTQTPSQHGAEANPPNPINEVVMIMAQHITDRTAQGARARIRRALEQKAKTGRATGRATLGYVNVAHVTQSTLTTEVEIDPVHAPSIRWAFETFANTAATVAGIQRGLNKRNLTPRPLSPRRVRAILSNRYYLGLVIFKGDTYPGKHPALVDAALFDTVQEKLRPTGRSQAGTH